MMKNGDQLARSHAFGADNLDVAGGDLDIGEARVSVDDGLILLRKAENVIAFKAGAGGVEGSAGAALIGDDFKVALNGGEQGARALNELGGGRDFKPVVAGDRPARQGKKAQRGPLKRLDAASAGRLDAGEGGRDGDQIHAKAAPLPSGAMIAFHGFASDKSPHAVTDHGDLARAELVGQRADGRGELIGALSEAGPIVIAEAGRLLALKGEDLSQLAKAARRAFAAVHQDGDGLGSVQREGSVRRVGARAKLGKGNLGVGRKRALIQGSRIEIGGERCAAGKSAGQREGGQGPERGASQAKGRGGRLGGSKREHGRSLGRRRVGEDYKMRK